MSEEMGSMGCVRMGNMVKEAFRKLKAIEVLMGEGSGLW
jgi:hypothetical protein